MSALGMLVGLSLIGLAGVGVALSGWAQPSPSLAGTLRHLRRPPRREPSAGGRRPVAGAGGQLGDALVDRTVTVLRLRPALLPSEFDLRVVGRSVEQHALYLASAALAGSMIPGVVLGGLQRSGAVGLGWYVPVVAGLAAGVLGPVLVHVATVERAGVARADLRYQVSAFLDVVTMLLAGNTGYEGALEQAARAGNGRLFVELRRRMREASARGASLTDALHHTGAELGLDELEQIAATAALSAAEGAPVARTLAAKCATLRMALATDQESEARLRTSRLTTPIVGMALIFMALVIYPALSFS